MNRDLFFESCGDERGTPQAFFDQLNAEFNFDIDVAASKDNAKCETFFGFGGLAENALEQDWGGLTCWLNCPYSVAGAFVAKAREEADKGATVVMLLPVRTDTKWWQAHIWDKDATSERRSIDLDPRTELPDGDWRPGVRCRFVSGRLSFELKVSMELRKLVKAAFIQVDRMELSMERDELLDETFKTLVETTGLPRMAIDGILKDKPDEDLLSSAPFPSCVVIFRRAE